MKGDFSRFTFDPERHYSGILMQQGRVQTDADINEQHEIARHRTETEIRDFIGQSGAPEENPGFEVRGQDGDILIGEGRYYVEGMLLENETPLKFSEQADLPDRTLPKSDGLFLAYLDVWRRHVTALEAPEIRDAALGDQDTATRIKNLWQVKLLRLGEASMTLSDEKIESLKPGRGWSPAAETGSPEVLPLSEGMLQAQVSGSGANLGNQLYRVEIHDRGVPGEATYKWSRDNGSLAAAVTSISDKLITIQCIGRGAEGWLKAGNILEITNDELELSGSCGILVVVSDARNDTLTLKIEEKDEGVWYNQIIGGGAIGSIERLRRVHTRARLWEGRGPVKDGTWLKLENGVEIRFAGRAESAPPYFKSGDYWLIPSRTLLRDIYWKRDAGGAPLLQHAHGIRHSYACLALLTRSSGVWAALNAPRLRVVFKNLVGGVVSKDGDYITGDMRFGKSLNVDGNIGIGVRDAVTRLDVNGDISAEIIYARTVRAARFEGGIERIIRGLEERIEALEKKAGIGS